MYLLFVVHKATINSLKVQILGDICVDQHTDQTTIGHHEL